MTATFTRNSRFGSSATASTKGFGVEIDLVLNNFPVGEAAGVWGGIPDEQASTHSLRYRDQPVGGILTDEVAASALIQGF